MFGFLKSKLPPNKNNENQALKKGWLEYLSESLKQTRNRLVDELSDLVLGKKTIDTHLLDKLEIILLSSDVGIETTKFILNGLSQQVARKSLSDPAVLINVLKTELLNIIKSCQHPLEINVSPFVILIVGVNGVGKTTTIAKLAHFYQLQRKRVMLAAGDTFRAAAIEQLQIWGQRNNVPVIAQRPGADSASVLYDAMEAVTARRYDLLIADTAGRFHTQTYLMDELKKIKRVIKKINPVAPQEILLVIDVGTGQNAINQAIKFNEYIGLTGITITKLDGTAKGGMIFAIAKTMQLPIRFIGTGEKIDDLKIFSATTFIAALFHGVTGS